MIDVGGHKRAEKQLISSLCSFLPEYAILVVSALTVKFNQEPIRLAKIFNLPMIVVVTHIDVTTAEQLRNFIYSLKGLLRELCEDRITTVIRSS
jgi:GTPase